MIEIREINAVEVIERAAPLLRANWAETGFEFEFNPSIEMYASLQQSGMLFALAAFDGDEIIGYVSAAVHQHPHNPAIRVAATDALFVDPRYRGCGVGSQLIDQVERIAAERGAVRISWHTRAGTGLAASLTLRGYTPDDVIVSRRL